jgi:hypothetical protein
LRNEETTYKAERCHPNEQPDKVLELERDVELDVAG